MRSRARSGALALACLTTLGVGLTAAPAQAADGIPGVRMTVCADSLYVRTDPGGAWMGTLSYPQTFDVKNVSGDWVYGFAYGNVNRNGWVQNGWFC
ncbi:hypothetical protein ACFYWN_40705 [Streptomyces sp. NPDC002917]|uniref:hypothetical protein n=2 Tax=Streptomyces TaxID=1883 RepID=UPI002E810145|nr:hypothetical protein [Streptomyces sp. NBC_00562]WTC77011.1 hypothetical protein OH719_03005 [Streptomyces sp. NBC_01653]WTD38495.1 hypothetical protein OHB03_43910 [Streptomyces sp. NBC_01643]WTD93849.1 hypothetical protein OG891_43855 [Streptomyces sp. NBC_01637]WTF25354.1 hypothetical protein OG955_03160 [Streptomyces sp. NBC_01602]WUC24821.1 hypothetical protein OHA33_42190 [Streptomyces sp. NBC_00562]